MGLSCVTGLGTDAIQLVIRSWLFAAGNSQSGDELSDVASMHSIMTIQMWLFS